MSSDDDDEDTPWPLARTASMDMRPVVERWWERPCKAWTEPARRCSSSVRSLTKSASVSQSSSDIVGPASESVVHPSQMSRC